MMDIEAPKIDVEMAQEPEKMNDNYTPEPQSEMEVKADSPPPSQNEDLEEGEDVEEGEITDDEENEEVSEGGASNSRISETEGSKPPRNDNPNKKGADSHVSDATDDDKKSSVDKESPRSRNSKHHKEKRKKSSKRRDEDSDEDKRRKLKEQLRKLEMQMGGPEDDVDDEAMGIYTAGGSPTRRARQTESDEFSEGRSSRSRSRSPKSRKRRRRSNSRDVGKKRRRDERERKGGRRGPREKSDEICKMYMQGKCPKSPDNCMFSHDAEPPKIFELCKFYLLDRCAKREKCLYLHKDFPCKFFHTGQKCIDTAESCKFSHEPLSTDTRTILLKHLESAPKEILGDFPRLTRDAAIDLVYKTEAKNKGWTSEEPPPDYVPNMSAPRGGPIEEGGISSVQEKLVQMSEGGGAGVGSGPLGPPNMGMNIPRPGMPRPGGPMMRHPGPNHAPFDQGPPHMGGDRRRKSRWESDYPPAPPGPYMGGHPPMFGPGGPHRMRGPFPRRNDLPYRPYGEGPGHGYPHEPPHDGYYPRPDNGYPGNHFPPHVRVGGYPSDKNSYPPEDDEFEHPRHNREHSSRDGGRDRDRDRSPTPVPEDEAMEEEQSSSLPDVHKQLYDRIQKKQKTNDASPEKPEEIRAKVIESWYESDEEPSEQKAPSDIINPSSVGKIGLPKELTEVLTALKSSSPGNGDATSVTLSPVPGDNVTTAGSLKRDPRMRRDPRALPNAIPATSQKVRDPRMKPKTEVSKGGQDITNIDLTEVFGDLELPTFKENTEYDPNENSMGLPFKPHRVGGVAEEIAASIFSHPPLEYRLRRMDIDKPDYSDMIVKHRLSTDKVQQDPRLRRYRNASPLKSPPHTDGYNPSQHAYRSPATHSNPSSTSSSYAPPATAEYTYNPNADLMRGPKGGSRRDPRKRD
ncbi:hypothetical protein TCAL_00669 [Tigriopus californicus]|uniref:C3H1-type domain-containing protein n=1 Tax=Tigriopus californicus TaxID=6832 RepID=A0A553PBT0_TIGCA|nr:protein suppressor of sable-like [Tigriopus californicus]XP_059097405.1 protein suppressor of sable-like [Tigriopus californicus]XP_059097414.1 protein suppressor of sable-like [Tigriopus californicus]TRY75137.1 hypothetical protein TCAL_00669 [Tigriopus californicus]|eukprot:TCALIF_00669-PA protein Name:"Similar to su(s) Protein suppressor of sable (Drosophila melanogaster)" AED:0.17 eAED:0.26 QI:0/-1/0/1/-1/1/1/0/909